MDEPQVEPERVPPPRPAPAGIDELAARAGLGPHRYSQSGRSPIIPAGRQFGRALGWFAGMVVVGLVTQKLGGGPLGIAALPFLSGGIVSIIKAIRYLVAGSTAAHLYANGLVHIRGGRIHVVTWPEVDKVLLSYFAGEQVSYHVVTIGGHKLRIDLESADGDPNLGLLLVEQAEALGRPVEPSGPSGRRVHGKAG